MIDHWVYPILGQTRATSWEWPSLWMIVHDVWNDSPSTRIVWGVETHRFLCRSSQQNPNEQRKGEKTSRYRRLQEERDALKRRLRHDQARRCEMRSRIRIVLLFSSMELAKAQFFCFFFSDFRGRLFDRIETKSDVWGLNPRFGVDRGIGYCCLTFSPTWNWRWRGWLLGWSWK